MPVYRVGLVSATPATTAAYASLNSATRKARVHEINLTLRTAVESEVTLGTPANNATPPVATSAITPSGDASDIAATARAAASWSTPPTAPTVIDATTILAAVKGAAWVWKWAPDEYLPIAIAGWKTFQNSGASTAGQLLINIVYEE